MNRLDEQIRSFAVIITSHIAHHLKGLSHRIQFKTFSNLQKPGNLCQNCVNFAEIL